MITILPSSGNVEAAYLGAGGILEGIARALQLDELARTVETGEDALERDKFLTADMARDFGIVDKVIDKRPEEAMPTKIA